MIHFRKKMCFYHNIYFYRYTDYFNLQYIVYIHTVYDIRIKQNAF